MTTPTKNKIFQYFAFGITLAVWLHVSMVKAADDIVGAAIWPDDIAGGPIWPDGNSGSSSSSGGNNWSWGVTQEEMMIGATSWLVDWTALINSLTTYADYLTAMAAAEESDNDAPGPVDIPIPMCCESDDCYEYMDSLINSIDRGMKSLYTLRRIKHITLLKARAYQSMAKAAGEFSPLAGAYYHATELKSVTEAEENFRQNYNSKTTLILGKIDAKYQEIGEIIDQQCSDTGWYLKNAWALNKTLYDQFVW